MKSIDKNDVDISRLFRWGKKAEIMDLDESVLTVYIRLVGDAELNRARVYALRKSAELRKELKKEGSDLRVAYIPDPNELDEEMIIEFIILKSLSELSTKALKNIDLRYPTEPDSDSTLEQLEEYQAKVDAYAQEREEVIHNAIEVEADKERERLKTLDKDALYKQFETVIINDLCEAEMVSRFRQMCAYFGTYTDSEFKKRLFDDFEEFDNLRKEIKLQFMDAYQELELGGDELKKSQEATQ